MIEAETKPYKLFQRPGTSKWWVRFSIKGHGQVRKSLETSDPVSLNARLMKSGSKHPTERETV
ncbi:hypothetical protein [Devosia sp. RR2S18]|uniref:hypothetical protein n=1 Tax=Devosia rhizosphaerae TaxID=3049774 RepID=UPI002540F84E|nr:hypothetical protein [Devosia sp. RR2S18]WIJ26114.1 hypothetical protein QOV41_04935 [Devosia sp. RR2S18]